MRSVKWTGAFISILRLAGPKYFADIFPDDGKVLAAAYSCNLPGPIALHSSALPLVACILLLLVTAECEGVNLSFAINV